MAKEIQTTNAVVRACLPVAVFTGRSAHPTKTSVHPWPFFRRAAEVSLLTAALLLAAGCGEKPTEVPSGHQTTAADTWFSDVTAVLGVDAAAPQWPDSRYFTPEVGSGGLALFDYDNDGDLDLYVVCHGPPDEYPQVYQTPAPNRLYQQQSDGTFRDVTEQSALGDGGFGTGVAAGDVDNDGDLDVYVCNFGGDRFYRNNGDGSFAEATEACGLNCDQPWSTSAGFFDYDRDGDLDLYVCRFGIYEPDRVCRTAEGRQEYCGPFLFNGLADTLYCNEGGGRFADVTEQAGIDVPSRAWGLLFADFNDDDWPDVYITNDEDPNLLWINRRDGTFVDEGLLRGVAVNGAGKTEGSMGVTAGDVDDDGRLDLFMTHINEETNTLFASGGSSVYGDASARSKIGVASLPMTGWGCALFDYDHDTDLDLAVVQGRIMAQPAVPGAALGEFWNRYAEPNVLFENTGQGRFVDTGSRAGPFAAGVEVSYSLAVGDIDNDGDLDLVTQNADNTVRIYRNEAGGGARHWLTVRPMVGPRDAYGAKVIVLAGGRRWVRIAHPTYGVGTSNDPRAHFGLGKFDRIEAIEVLWPDGTRKRFAAPAVDRIIVLHHKEA